MHVGVAFSLTQRNLGCPHALTLSGVSSGWTPEFKFILSIKSPIYLVLTTACFHDCYTKCQNGHKVNVCSYYVFFSQSLRSCAAVSPNAVINFIKMESQMR